MKCGEINLYAEGVNDVDACAAGDVDAGDGASGVGVEVGDGAAVAD